MDSKESRTVRQITAIYERGFILLGAENRTRQVTGVIVACKELEPQPGGPSGG